MTGKGAVPKPKNAPPDGQLKLFEDSQWTPH